VPVNIKRVGSLECCLAQLGPIELEDCWWREYTRCMFVKWVSFLC